MRLKQKVHASQAALARAEDSDSLSGPVFEAPLLPSGAPASDAVASVPANGPRGGGGGDGGFWGAAAAGAGVFAGRDLNPWSSLPEEDDVEEEERRGGRALLHVNTAGAPFSSSRGRPAGSPEGEGLPWLAEGGAAAAAAAASPSSSAKGGVDGRGPHAPLPPFTSTPSFARAAGGAAAAAASLPAPFGSAATSSPPPPPMLGAGGSPGSPSVFTLEDEGEDSHLLGPEAGAGEEEEAPLRGQGEAKGLSPRAAGAGSRAAGLHDPLGGGGGGEQEQLHRSQFRPSSELAGARGELAGPRDEMAGPRGELAGGAGHAAASSSPSSSLLPGQQPSLQPSALPLTSLPLLSPPMVDELGRFTEEEGDHREATSFVQRAAGDEQDPSPSQPGPSPTYPPFDMNGLASNPSTPSAAPPPPPLGPSAADPFDNSLGLSPAALFRGGSLGLGDLPPHDFPSPPPLPADLAGDLGGFLLDRGVAAPSSSWDASAAAHSWDESTALPSFRDAPTTTTTTTLEANARDAAAALGSESSDAYAAPAPSVAVHEPAAGREPPPPQPPSPPTQADDSGGGYQDPPPLSSPPAPPPPAAATAAGRAEEGSEEGLLDLDLYLQGLLDPEILEGRNPRDDDDDRRIR
jgi:hypothetical protein